MRRQTKYLDAYSVGLYGNYFDEDSPQFAYLASRPLLSGDLCGFRRFQVSCG